jgi:hypothetical protein
VLVIGCSSHPTSRAPSPRLSLSTSRATDFVTRLHEAHPEVVFTFFVENMVIASYTPTWRDGQYLLHWKGPMAAAPVNNRAWRARATNPSVLEREAITDIPAGAPVVFLDHELRGLGGYGFQGTHGIRVGDHVRTINNTEFEGGGVLTCEIAMCTSRERRWTLLKARGWIRARGERFRHPGIFYVACFWNHFARTMQDYEGPTQWLIEQR